MGGKLGEIWEDTKDEASDFWENVKEGDIGAIVEDALEFGLNWVSGGLYSYGKNKIEEYVEDMIPEQYFEDRKRVSRAAANPRMVVYGTAKVGGQLVYWESSGDDDRYLHMILVFAAHPINQFKEVWFDDELAATYNAGSWTFQGRWTQNVLMVPVTDGGTVPQQILDNAPSNWTSDHKLTDQAYIYFRFNYNRDQFNGTPNINVVLEGKADIYKGPSGIGFTDNAAWCIRDYMTWDRGMGLSTSEINETWFETAADICDELVASGVGTAEKRYTINGAFKFIAPPHENVKSMAKAAAGEVVRPIGGLWKFLPGSYIAPSASFNDDDLIGGVKFETGSSKSARSNVVKGTFISPDHEYEPVDFVEIAVNSYITQDGEELVDDLRLPFTNSGTMARRLAKIKMERSRFGVFAKIRLKYKALDQGIGDRISLSINALGWSNKIFRIENIKFDISKGMELELQEDDPAIYSWSEGEALVIEQPPVINLPNPYNVTAPSGFSFTEELYSTNVKKDIKTRAYVSWSPGGASTESYNVEVSREGGPYTRIASNFAASTIRMEDLEPGNFDVRVQGINGIGVRSNWAVYNFDVLGKTAPPPDVDTMFIAEGFLRWSYPSEPLDHAGYKVRYNTGSSPNWGTATPLHGGLITETRFDVSNFVGGEKTFLVKAVDTTGNESVNPVTVIQGLGDPDVGNVIVFFDQKLLGWPGTITNGTVHSSEGYLYPTGDTFFGSDGSNFFGSDNDPFFYGSFDEMVYEFTYTPSAGEYPAKMTIDLTATTDTVLLEYKAPADNISEWVEWPGALESKEGVTYYFRITMPAYTGGLEWVENLILNVDVPDIDEVLEDITISASGTRLPISKTYNVIKTVTMTLQDDGSGAASVKIVDKDVNNGPLVKIYDANDQGVQSIIDATVRGY